ncbi:hypothetical protein QG37_00553 [Candidozyma auris]|uniref:Uncharacterized protein n=1 Tax=Candidozyma auris TaxID=498019 RepID=A0A0L0P7T2_CANAR|nr:hypothetical protein QG37_00553 [[Candida] auris]
MIRERLYELKEFLVKTINVKPRQFLPFYLSRIRVLLESFVSAETAPRGYEASKEANANTSQRKLNSAR